MVEVPAGPFVMGSEGDPDAGEDESPLHSVELDAFWIDRTEVTNAQFLAFVNAWGYVTLAERESLHEGSQEPGIFGFIDGQWQYIEGGSWLKPEGPGSNLLGRERHPVVGIAWEDARAYCAWAGKRLPTEAEWEKAARGGGGARYPWGNAAPNDLHANLADLRSGLPWNETGIDDGHARTAAVGSYPNGASPYGVLDMAGNVWEWTEDVYDAETYRRASGTRNPVGPPQGAERVFRGGAFSDDAAHVRAARRAHDRPSFAATDGGFRCVADQAPTLVYLPLAKRRDTWREIPPTPTLTRVPPSPTPPPTTRPPTVCDPVGEQFGVLELYGHRSRNPAHRNPEFNLAMRGWLPSDASLGLKDYTGPTDSDPPFLADTLPGGFGNPVGFTSAWQVREWNPATNRPGEPYPKEPYRTTLIGMATSRGQTVHLPSRNTPIDPNNARAMVMYAEPSRITIKYTREEVELLPDGRERYHGYMLHFENVCVDPGLLALYEQQTRDGRSHLPVLFNRQAFGRAKSGQILVAIRDTGRFMDPRARKDWWRGMGFLGDWVLGWGR